jgi:predicted transcriptional regulator
MTKRVKLEIVKDMLLIIKEESNSIRSTPLLRKSNLSSIRFKEYLLELIEKGFVKEGTNKKGEKIFSLTDRGFKFLEKYRTIIDFIEEFEL